MERKEYNGWTNYETWLVNLWMDNEQGSQAYWREMAQECLDAETSEEDTADETTEACNEAARELAERIKGEHEDAQESQVTCVGLFADLLNAAMSEVDWRDIAQHLIDDLE